MKDFDCLSKATKMLTIGMNIATKNGKGFSSRW